MAAYYQISETELWDPEVMIWMYLLLKESKMKILVNTYELATPYFVC
jgi:hypothetical protein